MTTTTRTKKKIIRCLSKARSGSYGKYIQISATKGIKFYHVKGDSFAELQESWAYKAAYAEVGLLHRAKRLFPRVPKCYGVRVYRIDGKYCIGIVLQHLGPYTLGRFCHTKLYARHRQDGSIQEAIYEQLKQAGIAHTDIHSGNIMYYRNQYWVIDFGSNDVSIRDN